ncbi:hypothetical protein [Botrimarina sp.]|uniref:hypothetical protein n=1 Tax=Botrimarina sp. TaxID=2795802 RepID=UPI0032EAA1A2
MTRNLLSAAVLLAAAASALPALAQRPTAMRLFPSRSVVFFRTPEAATLVAKVNGSNFFTDPEIAPFLLALYSRIDDAFRSGPGQVTGGGLDELLLLFQGEVAVAVVPRRNEPPGVIALADTVSQLAAEDDGSGRQRAQELIDSLKRYAEQQGGGQVREEPVGATTATVFRPDNDASNAWGIAEREGVLLASNDPVLLESALLKWDEADGVASAPAPSPGPAEPDADAGDDEATADEQAEERVRRLRDRYAAPLAENAAFTEALRECVESRIGGGDAVPPDAAAFVDPIGIFRAASDGNVGMRFALATLPVLGLDGVGGAAAAMWIDAGEWDSLIRAHLLLDNPRAGVLKMARLEPTDPTPCDAIPADVASYTCGAVEFGAILDGAEQLHDKIRGEGTFSTLVQEQFTDKVGATPGELVSLLDGRFATIQGFGDIEQGEAPRVAPARAVLLRVNDPAVADEAVRRLLDNADVKVQWREHAGVPYLTSDREPTDSLRVEQEGDTTRVQSSADFGSAAILGDDLVLCQTERLLVKMIETHAGERPRLREHLTFRLTSSRAARLGADTVGGEEGRLLIYEDPGEQFRRWHAAGTSDESRRQLDNLAEMAPPMRWLRDALDDAGVPSLEALMRHAAPSGSTVYDTPRGFRYVQFTFKLDAGE